MDAHGVRHTRSRMAVADRLLVRLRPNADGAVVASAVGGRVARRMHSGLTILSLPAGTDVLAAAANLRGNPRVALVEPDGLVYPDLATNPPTDPGYSQQYHLPLIQAPLAWSVTQGLASIVVAVVDTGVQLSHPEFTGRIWQNPSPTAIDSGKPTMLDVNGWSFVDDTNDVSPHAVSGQANAQVGHGTLVAGTIAALANNGQGGCGVDWNCKIMPVKIFDANNGSPVSTVIEGIDYAWRHGAQIINLSLGSSTYFDSFTEPVHDAYAGNAAKGCTNRALVVCAAGNEYRQMPPGNQGSWESPVCNQWVDTGTGLTVNDVLGVAGTDQYDKKASWSNWAPAATLWVDVSAPGVNIYGPAYHDPANGFNDYYTTNSGTSFSTPIVSGIAALILSLHPGYTPDDLTSIIRSTADNVDTKNAGYAGLLGTGRVNVARALGIAIPPNVPTDFRAADTTGDDGGSITLAWTKSGDDGSGAMSVTAYNIYRGDSGTSLSLLTTVGPGTQTYVDTPTVDGHNYWYQLEVVAGTQSARTSVVGPATSRNDAPPPVVSMLTALDHPNDSGGAIDLDWTGYVAPADFLQYRVYRSQPNVRPGSIAVMTLLTTLSGPVAHQYTDSTTQDAADYYYAVTAKDTAGNENTTLSLTAAIQSYPNGQITLPGGLSLLSAATIPSDQDPATLFTLPPAQLNYSRWNQTAGQYEAYVAGTPLSDALKLALGRGFWVNLAAPLTFPTTGTIAPAGEFPITLQASWQQVGNPFLAPLDFSRSTVYASGTTMDLGSARTRRIMNNVAWVYDNAVGSYRLAYPDLGQGVLQIPPWRGFWVYAFSACQLKLQRPGTTTAGVTPAAVTPASAPVQFSGNEFALTLTASSGGATTPASYCGVASALSDYWAPAPPPARAGVEMGFTSGPQSVQATGPSMVSYAPALTHDLKWVFTVTSALAQTPVTVECRNVAKVPGDYNVLLRDVDAGRLQSLRQEPRYVYTSTDGGGVRHFELEIVRRTTAQMTVTGMMTQAVRGAGAQLVFTLSAPAATSVAVMNIAGIPIRTVEANRLRPAGANMVVWDGRNAGGAPVPGGMYLMRLDASDDSGNRVSVLRNLNVTR